MNALKDDNNNSNLNSGFGQFGAPPSSSAEAPDSFGANAPGFGGTNAVSQMFPDNNLDKTQSRKKLFLYGGLGLSVIGIAYLLLSSSEEAVVPVAAPVVPAPAVAIAPEIPAPAAPVEAADDTEATPATAPVQNTTYTYNEIDGGPTVTVADGSRVEVSLTSDFSSLYVSGRAKNGSFRIPSPPPGNVYWRIKGDTAVNQITINPPAPLSLSLNAPSALSQGTEVSWSGNGDAAYYRLELSNDIAFATQNKSLNLPSMPAGDYSVRLGGLSLASGRWEYTSAVQLKGK
jgi:hypothetical protein